MRRTVAALLLAALAAVSAFADYPPTGWTDSLLEGISTARAEGKMILLDFTGSDWCIWCKRLSEQVWTTDAFEAWAEANAVLVFLDFPRDIAQDDALKMQNYVLQQAMGIEGYPTVWLLDADLTPLLRTGYREGGAEAYIAHLENDRLAIDAETQRKFRDAFTAVIEQYLGPLD